MALAHSYSSIKQFENCPRQYNEVRILKKYKTQESEAMLYGTAVHKAFEDFIKDGTPIPAKFAQFLPMIQPLTKIKGQVFCEQKMGITADFKPCDFFAKNVWFRGVPDLLIVNPKTNVARVVDYKTGKSSRYADTAQLELMAAMVMAYYPNVQTVKGALLFVVADDIIKGEYTRADMPTILSSWAGKASRIEESIENGVWNAKPSGLCKFCPVQSCEHNS